MPKFDFEKAAVERLCNLLEYTSTGYRDPNPPGVESGADVEMRYNSSRIGVQVTEYHADEGQTPVKGSRLRADEEKKAKEALKSDGVVKVTRTCRCVSRCAHAQSTIYAARARHSTNAAVRLCL